ncbi:DUF523 domain-containing protein [Terasakiella sp. A23]|uniref:DUF523 domain-containing protein n=1 Tax=Terasakiella sp. FCG-A23 TaxID=3080561 RepID=UPI002955CAAD|nr:DUF523 domain-containing protein [Terasakiella sp. A23]MDV7339845.1 DUF523 domain-containing protein [Terasakiella sp. A23]
MEKILVSACLMGEKVRYDAGDCLIDDPVIQKWQAEGRLVPLCPEMAGGLPAPRPPAERDLKTGRILDKDGNDFTEPFEKGAEIALALVQEHQIKYALLKERSPSCGVNIIYDGSFTSVKIPGSGLTASLLKENGLLVFSEFDLDGLKSALDMI